MRKIRAPKNLSSYTTAEEAARGLEDMAADIRRAAAYRPMVRYSINFSFWNPAWIEESGPLQLHGLSLGNAPVPARDARSIPPQAEPEAS